MVLFFVFGLFEGKYGIVTHLFLCYPFGTYMQNTQNDSANTKRNLIEAQYGVGRFVFEVFKVFLLAVVIIVPIRVFLFQPFFVKGASMEPNFHEGEYLIVNEWGYKYTQIGLGNGAPWATVKPGKEFERGDVIIFRAPQDPSQFFIKRVIALPGEAVRIKDGSVYIYNKKSPAGFVLDESQYLSDSIKTTPELSLELGDDEYFVMGDNRNNSHDSRAWGPLNKNMVIGKVLLRAWPANKATLFTD